MPNSKKNKDVAKGKSDGFFNKEEVSNAKKEGFSLLAQGTFGCIYHPGMTCDHKPLDEKYITKIHSSEEKTAINEIAVSKKVQTIPNYELYFSPVLQSCDVNLAKVDREEVEKCNFIKDDIDHKKPMTYISTKIRFIDGGSLMEYVAKHPKYSTISFLYKTLCENVKKLAEKEIVHFDLRENNMIVSKKGIPIIIDFGISIDFTNKLKKSFLKNMFYAFTTKYKPWCIEITLICFIVNHKPSQVTQEKVMEIFDEVMELNDFANKPYLKEEFPKYREKFKTQISTKPRQELLDYLLSTYKHWDLYSVTILLIQMLETTNQTPDETHAKQMKEQLFFSASL
jgi:serine/threonine protein kinase